MTVSEARQIDFISIDPAGDVVLAISDHLDWQDVDAHLFVLQAKLNAYLAFVENGELHAAYPHMSHRRIRIDVLVKYDPPASAQDFLENVRNAIAGAGMGFGVRKLDAT